MTPAHIRARKHLTVEVGVHSVKFVGGDERKGIEEVLVTLNGQVITVPFGGTTEVIIEESQR